MEVYGLLKCFIEAQSYFCSMLAHLRTKTTRRPAATHRTSPPIMPANIGALFRLLSEPAPSASFVCVVEVGICTERKLFIYDARCITTLSLLSQREGEVNKEKEQRCAMAHRCSEVLAEGMYSVQMQKVSGQGNMKWPSSH